MWAFSLPVASAQNKNAKLAWAFIQVGETVGAAPRAFFGILKKDMGRSRKCVMTCWGMHAFRIMPPIK